MCVIMEGGAATASTTSEFDEYSNKRAFVRKIQLGLLLFGVLEQLLQNVLVSRSKTRCAEFKTSSWTRRDKSIDSNLDYDEYDFWEDDEAFAEFFSDWENNVVGQEG